jgi:hypothetical protein
MHHASCIMYHAISLLTLPIHVLETTQHFEVATTHYVKAQPKRSVTVSVMCAVYYSQSVITNPTNAIKSSPSAHWWA